MTNDPSRDFSIEALYAALDAARRARGITWQETAREISSLFARAAARPISPSTLTALRGKRAVEGDGVLQMLRWLNRSPESFVVGYRVREGESTALPDVPPHKILRFDTAALHAALNAQRVERAMTWKEVAAQIGGVAPAALTQLSNGGRTAFPLVMRLSRWLGRPAAAFTRASDS